jgi:CrcB protein
MAYVLILFGAGIGGVVRYGLGPLNKLHFAGYAPLGTLLANVMGAGCLAWGIVQIEPFALNEVIHWSFRSTLVYVIVGISGGLSTFSTLIGETVTTYRSGFGKKGTRCTRLWLMHILFCALAARIAYGLV